MDESQVRDQNRELVSTCCGERGCVGCTPSEDEGVGEDIQTGDAGEGHRLAFAYADRMRFVEAVVAWDSCSHLSRSLEMYENQKRTGVLTWCRNRRQITS